MRVFFSRKEVFVCVGSAAPWECFDLSGVLRFTTETTFNSSATCKEGSASFSWFAPELDVSTKDRPSGDFSRRFHISTPEGVVLHEWQSITHAHFLFGKRLTREYAASRNSGNRCGLRETVYYYDVMRQWLSLKYKIVRRRRQVASELTKISVS